MGIIQNGHYFFLTKSVFSEASKDQTNDSFKFLQKSVLLKLIHRDKMNPHVVFFPRDCVNEVRKEFGENFESLVEIGENMFSPEENPRIKGDINWRVLQYATDKDGEISNDEKVMVVVSDNETKKFFDKAISVGGYPIECITIKEAIKTIALLEKMFKEGHC